MDDNLKDYIFEDDPAERDKLSEKLLNSSTETFYDECHMDNLLKLARGDNDISEKVIKTLETEDKLNKFANNVLISIRTNKRNNTILYIISGIAAILILSLVLISLDKRVKPLTAGKEGTSNQPIPADKQTYKIVELPEGVKLRVYENTTYEFINKEGEFLNLKSGKLLVEVESRKNKNPLYFTMSHNKVRVTGTSFTLICDSKRSFVNVHEGQVDVIENGKVITVSAQESFSTDYQPPPPEDVLNGLVRSYPFENLNGLKYEGSPKIVAGINGNALKFDDSTHFIIPRNTNVPAESISFWFKVDDLFQGPQSIISQTNVNDGNDGFNIIINKKLILSLQLKNSSVMANKGSKYQLDKEKWYHVTYCRNENGEYSFYVDGLLIHSDHFKYSYKTANIYVGNTASFFWKNFTGSIDELRVYNRPLSAKEVQKLYRKK